MTEQLFNILQSLRRSQRPRATKRKGQHMTWKETKRGRQRTAARRFSW